MVKRENKKVQRQWKITETDNFVTSARGTTIDKKNIALGYRRTSPVQTNKVENTGREDTLQTRKYSRRKFPQSQYSQDLWHQWCKIQRSFHNCSSTYVWFHWPPAINSSKSSHPVTRSDQGLMYKPVTRLCHFCLTPEQPSPVQTVAH